MFPLRHKADDYAFKCSLRLHDEYAFHRGEKWVEVEVFPEASLQIFPFLLLLRHLEALLRRLVPVGEVVSIHYMHVVNTARPSLSEVSYQQTSLLIQHLFFHRQIV